MEQKEIYKQAKERVEQKKGFYRHLAAYIAVGCFFLVMNIVTWNEEGKVWFFFPLLPWGIGVVIHYLNVFGFPGTGVLSQDWEQRELEREAGRLRRKYAEEGPVEDASSSEEEAEGLDLEKVKRKEKSGRWENEDLV